MENNNLNDNKEPSGHLKFPTFPFITRDMLKYGRGGKIQVRVTIQSLTTKTLRLRMLNREGFSEFACAYTSTGAQQSFTFDVSDIPTFLSVNDDSGDVEQGTSFATVRLLVDSEIVFTFCSGLVYTMKGISYPVGTQQDVVPGRGGFRHVAGANPAAGSEASITCPSSQMWRLIYMQVTLVTDATAATRQLHFTIGGNTFGAFSMPSPVSQTASLTRNYFIAPFGYLPAAAVDNDIVVPVPPELWIWDNDSFATVTTNLQAGDNYGTPTAAVEQLWSVGH